VSLCGIERYLVHASLHDRKLFIFTLSEFVTDVIQPTAGTLPQLGAHQPATRDPRLFPYLSQREILLYLLPVFFAVIIHYYYLFLLSK
jgi:hypothetical protein